MNVIIREGLLIVKVEKEDWNSIAGCNLPVSRPIWSFTSGWGFKLENNINPGIGKLPSKGQM